MGQMLCRPRGSERKYLESTPMVEVLDSEGFSCLPATTHIRISSTPSHNRIICNVMGEGITVSTFTLEQTQQPNKPKLIMEKSNGTKIAFNDSSLIKGFAFLDAEGTTPKVRIITERGLYESDLTPSSEQEALCLKQFPSNHIGLCCHSTGMYATYLPGAVVITSATGSVVNIPMSNPPVAAAFDNTGDQITIVDDVYIVVYNVSEIVESAGYVRYQTRGWYVQSYRIRNIAMCRNGSGSPMVVSVHEDGSMSVMDVVKMQLIVMVVGGSSGANAHEVAPFCVFGESSNESKVIVVGDTQFAVVDVSTIL
eukprot:PhF_6_TR25635/c0_g1_i3/m.36044